MKKTATMLLCICILAIAGGCSKGEVKGETAPSQGSASSSAPAETTAPSAPPVDLGNLENLRDTYLMPILFSGATRESWSDANTLDAQSLVNMYGFAQVWNANIPESEMVFENAIPYYYVREAILEEYVTNYFIVSVEHLHTSEDYDAEKKAYKFNMSGVGFAYNPQVKRGEYDDIKRQLNLYIDSGFDENTNEFAVLTILLQEDGRFLYIGDKLL